jgi:hypothetical protein
VIKKIGIVVVVLLILLGLFGYLEYWQRTHHTFGGNFSPDYESIPDASALPNDTEHNQNLGGSVEP